jgi:hypothetical protein
MDVWAASTLAAHKVERSSSPPRTIGGHDSEHVLLVVDGPAAVGGHRWRGVVRRDWDQNLIALGDFNIDRQDDPLYQAFTSTGLTPAAAAGRAQANDLRHAAGAALLLRPDRLVHQGADQASGAEPRLLRGRELRLRVRTAELEHAARSVVAYLRSLPALGRVRGART